MSMPQIHHQISQLSPNNSQAALISPQARQPPRDITIQPVTPVLLPQYRRLITSLLPIRYQEKYFTETISNTTSSSLAVCAVWRDPSRNCQRPGGQRKAGSARAKTSFSRGSKGNGRDQTKLKEESGRDECEEEDKQEEESEVVGGIQCRLESSSLPSPPISSRTSSSSAHSKNHLYISTLFTAPSHRNRGIAASLLAHVLQTVLTHPDYAVNDGFDGSYENKDALVGGTATGPIESVFAHVWTKNQDALEWYLGRGFHKEGTVREGYYRRLKPSGAWVVRKKLGICDAFPGAGISIVRSEEEEDLQEIEEVDNSPLEGTEKG